MKIVLLGAGNVGSHLGKALKTAGHHILQVWSRDHHNALALADELSSQAIKTLAEADNNADVVIICVKDEAIADVAKLLSITNQLIIHTSGTQSIDILHQFSQSFGVIYPLQTFSKNKAVNFKEIPVFYEGNNASSAKKLKELASSISESVKETDSEKRKKIHVAAVFACNFTNHFYVIAENFLVQNDLSFEDLKPLIAETASKIKVLNPLDAQTGPALRQDQEILNQHIAALSNYPHWQNLYRLISQDIVKMAKEKNG